MPPYSGTITLLISILILGLKAFKVPLPEGIEQTLNSAAGDFINAALAGIGIWRLLHTKAKVDQAGAVIAGLTQQVNMARAGEKNQSYVRDGLIPAKAPTMERDGVVMSDGRYIAAEGANLTGAGIKVGAPISGPAVGGGPPIGKRAFSTRPLVAFTVLALMGAGLGGCPLRDIAGNFGGTPTQSVKTTIYEVYADACTAFFSAEHLAAQAITDRIPQVLARVDTIQVAQKAGQKLCLGPLPVNLAQALVDVGATTLVLTTALAAK